MRTLLRIIFISPIWLSIAMPHLLSAQTQTTDEDGFRFAVPDVPLQFPRDHGSHPDFKTEWWYITGHVSDVDRSTDLGFQLTFFRSASRSSDSGVIEQTYLAHAAITDKRSGKFHHEERLNSDDWNADASTEALDLYNGNWSLRMTNPNTEAMQARFSLKDIGVFQLNLNPAKSKTLFGDEGYSKKGDQAGAASYYITFTRLEVSGTLKNNHGEAIDISGMAWMDHEYSSSQLTPEQIGWNWTSLILEDGSELMAYVMRREDNKVDPHSRLTLVSPNGKKTEFLGSAFSWEPVRFWTSPESGGRYPVEYEIKWIQNGVQKTIHVTPAIDEQELKGKIGDFVYWEGASEAFDENGNAVGRGYTELTGYAESLYGKF